MKTNPTIKFQPDTSPDLRGGKRAGIHSIFIPPTWAVVVIALAIGTVVGTGQTKNSTFLGTRWDLDGPDKAALIKAKNFDNGTASWSIVAPGKEFQAMAPDIPAHFPLPPDLVTKTLDFDDLLLPKANRPNTPAQLFAQAIGIWEAGSKMSFRNLGQVADGGGPLGGPNNMGSNLGDIRAAVLRFVKPLPMGQQPDMDVLAHAFTPDTVALNFIQGFGTLGGDVHFRPHEMIDGQRGVDWVDDANAALGKYDLLTVMIHEVGHALGLGHNTGDDESVMLPTYGGPRRTLSKTDIQNIRELYTPLFCRLDAIRVGNTVVISWPEDETGWTLQTKSSLGAVNWMDYPDSGTNSVAIPLTNSTGFFRLIQPATDLALTMVATPNPVTVSNDLTYDITVTNRGPREATDVIVTDALPEGAVLVSVVPTQGTFTNQDSVISCALGNLAGGQGAAITIVVSPQDAGLLINAASAASNEADLTPADNTDSAVTSVVASP